MIIMLFAVCVSFFALRAWQLAALRATRVPHNVPVALYASGELDPFGQHRYAPNAKQADRVTGLFTGGEF